MDTSNVTDMSSLFYGCENLTSVDLSGLDTSKVTNMSSMFSRCYNLESVDLRNFDTKQVTNMSWMFESCSNLTDLDLSSFDTPQLKDMSNMFSRCYNLINLDLSNFDISQITSGTLFECNKLRTIKTPKKTGENGFGLPKGAWRDENGVYYEAIPKNATQSLTLSYYIAYGEYGDVKWSIDKDGALLVTGNGEMYKDNSETPLWNNVSYRSKITSAKVEVTGATKVMNLFREAKNMTTLDMSNFDMSGVARWQDCWDMLRECDSLTTIYTPKKTGKNTPLLPSYEGYVWIDGQGNEYTKLPENATESIVLTKVTK